MSRPAPDYAWFDEAMLAGGLGLVLLGLVVLGVVETLLGSVHVTERTVRLGVIVVHTSFTPGLRPSLVAIGFLVLFGWSLSRIGRAIAVDR